MVFDVSATATDQPQTCNHEVSATAMGQPWTWNHIRRSAGLPSARQPASLEQSYLGEGVYRQGQRRCAPSEDRSGNSFDAAYFDGFDTTHTISHSRSQQQGARHGTGHSRTPARSTQDRAL